MLLVVVLLLFSLIHSHSDVPFFQTTANTPAETLHLLSFGPNRLGHATFLDDEAKAIVLRDKICIEICLSSNLLCVRLLFYVCHLRVMISLSDWQQNMTYRCKTVSTLDDHHIRYYLKNDHPIAICVRFLANSALSNFNPTPCAIYLSRLNRQMTLCPFAIPSSQSTLSYLLRDHLDSA